MHSYTHKWHAPPPRKKGNALMWAGLRQPTNQQRTPLPFTTHFTPIERSSSQRKTCCARFFPNIMCIWNRIYPIYAMRVIIWESGSIYVLIIVSCLDEYIKTAIIISREIRAKRYKTSALPLWLWFPDTFVVGDGIICQELTVISYSYILEIGLSSITQTSGE